MAAGERSYRDIAPGAPLDTSNFADAIDHYRAAVTACATDALYADVVIFRLGTSLLYVGQFSQSAYYYRMLVSRFPHNKDVPIATKEMRLLSSCSADSLLETYRRARLFEVHLEVGQALSHFALVERSTCGPLRERARERIGQLRRP